MVAWEALDGDRLVGFYGAIPERWRLRGKDVVLYQAMDAMTDPDYRGRGIFVNLARRTKDDIIQNHGGWLVGFPGTTAYRGQVEVLNWRDVGHSRSYFLPRLAMIAAGLAHTVAKRKQFRLATLLSFGAETDDYFARRAARPTPIEKAYNGRFLNWRIWAQPGNSNRAWQVIKHGQMVGLVIASECKGSLVVAMADFVDGDTHQQLFAPVLGALCRESKMHWVEIIEPRVEWALQACTRVPMLFNPLSRGRFSFRLPFMVYAHPWERDGVDLFNIKNYDMHLLLRDY
jgi:hypothetical protein